MAGALTKAVVEFHCCNCGVRFTADMWLAFVSDGEFKLVPGNLYNDWGLRWARSHVSPKASLVSV